LLIINNLYLYTGVFK